MGFNEFAGYLASAYGLHHRRAGAGLLLAALAVALLVLGTALVYPTLLAAVSDVAHPSRKRWKPKRIGLFHCLGARVLAAESRELEQVADLSLGRSAPPAHCH